MTAKKKRPASVSRAMKHPDRPGAGAKQRRKLKSKKNKIHAVMAEAKRGTLRSGSGHKVKSKAQAIAIALSEARRSGKKGRKGGKKS